MVSSIIICMPSRAVDIHHRNNQVVGVSFSLPFGQAGSLTTRFNHDKNYGSQLQSSYTGSAGEKNAFSYGLTASYDMPRENPNEASVAANGSLRTDYAYLNASASAGRHQQQYSLGASGATVAHQGGMTATPNWGNLRHCGSARRGGGQVANRLGQPINRRGFTIIPYLDPFTANWLDLDPQGLNDHVEIVSSSTTVVPDSGAAVKVKFVTRTGYARFAHVTLPDGAAPPAGRGGVRRQRSGGWRRRSGRAAVCPGAAGPRQRLGSMGRTQRATLPVGLCHPRRRGAAG